MLVWVQRPQHKSTPDPVAAPKNIPFGTIFIEFGNTKKCCTFSGLELAPKSRTKLIGALSCMHKAPKCIQSLWDYPKKFLLCKSTKKARYVKMGFFPKDRTYRDFLNNKLFFLIAPRDLHYYWPVRSLAQPCVVNNTFFSLWEGQKWIFSLRIAHIATFYTINFFF